jgi:hypothetical protein
MPFRSASEADREGPKAEGSDIIMAKASQARGL